VVGRGIVVVDGNGRRRVGEAEVERGGPLGEGERADDRLGQRYPPALPEPSMPTDTIPARLLSRAAERAAAPAYFVRADDGWVAVSWKGYAEQVRAAAKALIALDFQSGEKLCILGFNRPEWAILDLAAMMAGGAPAGIYTTCSPSEVQYIVHHTDSRVVLVENQTQWAKLDAEKARLPALRHIVLMRGAATPEDGKAMSWEDFLARGAAVPDSALDARIASLQDGDLATLIYTSGTTGPPKGVMLSHENLRWTADCARGMLPIQPDDCTLSYLPLSHIAEQMFTLHVPISTGCQVYFAQSIEKLKDNLQEVQPTVLFAVPRIWEKFHAAVAGGLQTAPPLRQKIAAWALGVGKAVNALRNRGAEPSGWLAFQYRLATRLVYSKAKPKLGMSRAKYCVTGAAPISQEIIEFFMGLDISIREVYGQSEDTGPTSFNLPGRTKPGSVGPIIPGIEVRIAEDGEILVKGPNVFLGYAKEPAATAEVLVDGWLHSGDLGRIDDDGFLHITGRKKDILITAGGKNIAPKNIEAALKQCPIIGEAVVIGDRKPYLTALVSLDAEAVAAAAKERGLEPAAIFGDPQTRDVVDTWIRECVNPELARVEQVKTFTILAQPLSIEGGELTPTLKVKRAFVNKKYEAEIEAMYARGSAEG
jgi:long-chain acyl-CoA synthetase